MQAPRMLIDGEWVEAASGRTFETLDPATEDVLAEIAHGDAEDVERAVRREYRKAGAVCPLRGTATARA
jgi:aldehyde dehydrogenase (NAD+)